MSTDPQSPSGTTRTRRTRAELRDLMMAAGKEVLFQIEPTLGFEQLTYSAVFTHLQEHFGQRVTIGSVHERLWKNQRDFQLDVVADALHDPIPTTHKIAFERAAAVIASADLTSPEGRRRAARQAVRLSTFQLNDQAFSPATDLAQTVRFRLWALGPEHPEADGFTEAITAIRAASTLEYTKVVRALMQLLGLRVRADAGDPDQAIETVALLANAAMIGLTTDVLPQTQRARQLPTGPDGQLEAWHLDAIALWASVRTTFELDGDDLDDDERRL